MKALARKILAILVILVAWGWLYTKIMWPSTITDAPEILANLYAKELCTCRYVVGQSLERCFENHANIMRPSKLVWDEPKKSVHVRVLWATSDAKVVSERLGCVRTNFGNPPGR